MRFCDSTTALGKLCRNSRSGDNTTKGCCDIKNLNQAKGNMPPAPISHTAYVQRLYRESLRTAFDHHAFQWDIYRQHCLRIRARFEANRAEENPIRIKALVKETEDELASRAHPRPFKYPTAEGGVKHGRNHVPSEWLCQFGEGNWQADKIEFEKIK
eukprot:Partr_v1_DN28361_c1_g2_i1_m78498 putative LYR family